MFSKSEKRSSRPDDVDPGAVPGERLELGPRVASGRGVELIGLGDELGGARRVGRRQGLDMHFRREVAIKIFDAAEAGPLLAGRPSLCVALGTAAVLLGQLDAFEVGAVEDGFGIAGRVVGQLDHLDRRQHHAHARPLGRIIVDEGDGLEAEADLLGNLQQGLRLVAPIDPEGREVIFLQDHVRQLGDGGTRLFLVVLAGDGQGDAARGQSAQDLLEMKVGIARIVAAELKAFQAVLAQDAAPERVVEVEHQQPRRASGQREDEAGVAPGQRLAEGA